MIIVDTSVLSLAIRRRRPELLSGAEQQIVREFLDLTDRGDAVLLGVIRQELLSGIRHREQFDRVRLVLDGYDYLDVTLADHDFGAECFNTCRAHGVAAGDVDMLITAVAIRRDLPIFTTDPDFKRYAVHLAIRLHST